VVPAARALAQPTHPPARKGAQKDKVMTAY